MAYSEPAGPFRIFDLTRVALGRYPTKPSPMHSVTLPYENQGRHWRGGWNYQLGNQCLMETGSSAYLNKRRNPSVDRFFPSFSPRFSCSLNAPIWTSSSRLAEIPYLFYFYLSPSCHLTPSLLPVSPHTFKLCLFVR